MKKITRKTKKIFNKVSSAVKETATTSGLVDRKEIVITSHRRKCLHKAFWKDQVQCLRDIQNNLQENYNGSKALACFCCCRKEDLKTMIDEAADDFHALPRQVLESGREAPITADTELKTINLDQYKSFLPSTEYYAGRDVGDLEQEKRDLKADIADLMKEHRHRYNALQKLADQHRHFRIIDKEPSTRQMKTVIKAACLMDEQGNEPPREESEPLLP